MSNQMTKSPRVVFDTTTKRKNLLIKYTKETGKTAKTLFNELFDRHISDWNFQKNVEDHNSKHLKHIQAHVDFLKKPRKIRVLKKKSKGK